MHLSPLPVPICRSLKGWFWLDVLTCIPFDVIVHVALILSTSEASELNQDAQMFRLLKMARIIKLMRMLRASRIFSRWQNHLSLSFAMLSLIKFLLLTAILAHWLACVWGFVGLEGDGEWVGFDDATHGRSTMITWRQMHGVVNASLLEAYSVSLYVALNSEYEYFRIRPSPLAAAC